MLSRSISWFAPLALGLVACAGEVSGGGDDGDGGVEPRCEGDNGAPAAPIVVSPVADRRDVLAADLVLEGDAYVDVEGDAHDASQFEIWQVAGGAAVQRVWSAEVSDPASLTRAALADGAFDVGTGLDLDQGYEVRIRYRAADGCTAWSAWSEPRRFLTDDGSTAFFAEGEIRDVHLTIPQGSLDGLNAQANPPGCVPYERDNFTADLTFEGVDYPGVGIKIKGGCGSARNMSGKASFKIDLEWDDPAIAGCPGERRLAGQKHLTLNNTVQDPSYVHQILAYDLYRRMGVPAPRANFVRVHVNGQLWGLYTNVETVDRRMLRRWFASNDGMMYEGTYWCDLVSSSVPATDDHEDDTAQCIGREFEEDACSGTPTPEADPTDYALARALVDQLGDMPSGGFAVAAEQIFDFDAVLSMWAVDAIINHWDGFVYDIMNNYRIYHDPSTDRWTVLPSGTDQTFTMNRARSAFDVANVVARLCLAEEACRDAFAARLDQALDVFAAADLAGRAQALAQRIGDDVVADPRRGFSVDDFQRAVLSTIEFVEGRAATLRADLQSNGY